MPVRLVLRSAAIALVAASLLTDRAAAQGLGWHGQAALSGNVFFGNNRQVLVGTRLGAEHIDSTLQNRNEVRFNYGEATDQETDRDFVSKRSWLATSSLDYRPFLRVNPFAQGAFESSLEKKISRRYSVGAGTRLNFVRTPRTEAIASLGALIEQTRALDPERGNPTTSLGRAIASFRAKRAIGTRVVFTSESRYEPALKDLEKFTFATDNGAIVTLRQNLSFTASFRDTYDSEARRRGARKYNDGELLFGVLASF